MDEEDQVPDARDVVRRTDAVKQILRILDCAGDLGAYGSEIINRTKLRSSTVYPILRRFQARGLAVSEERDARVPGRSRNAWILTEAGCIIADSLSTLP